MQKLRSSELFLLPTVFRFFEDGELWFLCGGFSAGLAGFKKMLHRVWGRELPQDNVRSTPRCRRLCALTDWKEMRTNASVVQKLFRVDFFALAKASVLLLLLAPPYAGYSLYALLIINSIKHEGYTWLRHINHTPVACALFERSE